MIGTSAIVMLRIEIPGHIRGKEPKRPWVAEVGLTDRGLRRTFLRGMYDWANARRKMSGNLYGVVATYPLREGRLYEVAQYDRNDFVREFFWIEAGKMLLQTQEEAQRRLSNATV